MNHSTQGGGEGEEVMHDVDAEASSVDEGTQQPSPSGTRYYLDCEFNGARGELLSMALKRKGVGGLYWINGWPQQTQDPWVSANVIPILRDCPAEPIIGSLDDLPAAIEHCFLAWGDLDPIIVTDWPDDIKYFAESVLTGPGTMIRVRSLRFEMHRVDAYPTTLAGAVQHNAWWDALALEHLLLGYGDAKLSSSADDAEQRHEP